MTGRVKDFEQVTLTAQPDGRARAICGRVAARKTIRLRLALTAAGRTSTRVVRIARR